MKLKGLRIALYARYSSEMQRESSIEDQLRRCRQYVERHGGQVDPDLIFTDRAESAASLARRGFEAMMRAVQSKPRQVDAIVTDDISRISRDFADSAILFKRLQYEGVPLHGVADGIDTSEKHAKLTYTVKSLVNDLYLDDLRDKTLRGLEGRALAGYSTGSVPYGYRTFPVQGEDPRHVIGYRIEIDPEQAEVIRKLAQKYLAGQSLTTLAAMLNRDQVPPPRARTKHRRRGWVASTVRDILHNEKYVGVWTFKEKRWVKIPGTNRRKPFPRHPSEIIRQERPGLRILDDATWGAVQERLGSVHRRYTKHVDGTPKGRAAPGRVNRYPLSGVLYCDACGAPLVVYGSTPTYRCSDHIKRQTCSNRVAINEEAARELVVKFLREHLASKAGLDYLREKIAERLGSTERNRGEDIKKARDRLARTEEQIKRLISFIAEGPPSDYVTSSLRELEAQARIDKHVLAELELQDEAPIELPSLREVLDRVKQIELLMTIDPPAAREALRPLFENGEFRIARGDDGNLRIKVGLRRGELVLQKNGYPPVVSRTYEATGDSQRSGGKI